MNETRKFFTVYTIVEGYERIKWVEIGIAFTDKDGSLNLILDALPVNGKLHLRPWKSKRNDNH